MLQGAKQTVGVERGGAGRGWRGGGTGKGASGSIVELAEIFELGDLAPFSGVTTSRVDVLACADSIAQPLRRDPSRCLFDADNSIVPGRIEISLRRPGSLRGNWAPPFLFIRDSWDCGFFWFYARERVF